MPGSPRGLYETLITEALDLSLAEVDERSEVRRDALREADAADRIALHLARIVERAVASFGREERVEKGIALARKLIDEIELAAAKSAESERPVSPAAVLRAVVARLPSGVPEVISA